MITIKATTQNGNPITGTVRQKLTKNGLLFINFWDRPKNIKEMKITATVQTNGNTFDLDLSIQDVEARFPGSTITSKIVD